MKYLLDTNIISEPSKKKPDPNVLAWFEINSLADGYIASASLGEIAQGIALLEMSQRRNELELWYNNLKYTFVHQVINADAEIFECWGRQQSALAKRGRTPPMIDGLIAATAIIHRLTLVTRNVKDFQIFDIKLENPFD
jgi:toxin FitB